LKTNKNNVKRKQNLIKALNNITCNNKILINKIHMQFLTLQCIWLSHAKYV